MIETPRAIFNLLEIVAAARTPRLKVLVMGLNDLAKETRMRAGRIARRFIGRCRKP